MSHAYLGRRRYRTHSRRVLISPHPVAHVPLTWRELYGFVWLWYCAVRTKSWPKAVLWSRHTVRIWFFAITCRWTLGFSNFLQTRLKNVTRTWGWTRANNYTIFIWLYFVSARWFIEIYSDYWVTEQYNLPCKTIDFISATSVLAINALKKNRLNFF